MLWCCLSLVVAAAPISSLQQAPSEAAQAQEPPFEHLIPDIRYEMGLRVVRMEREFERASSQQRLNALAALNEAVRGFFSARFQFASSQLDLATSQLSEDEDTSWADGLALTTTRWIENPSKLTGLTISQFYATAIPENAEYRIVGQPQWTSLPTLPHSLILDVDLALDAAEGTGRLTWAIEFRQADGETLRRDLLRSSRIKGLRDRARQVQAIERQWREQATDWRTETARLYLEILASLLNGDQYEIWIDGIDLLEAAESLTFAQSADDDTQPDSVLKWLRRLPPANRHRLIAWPIGGRARYISRIQLPPHIPGNDAHAAEPESYALVIALHGMGGSENMFFSSYGAGKVTRLAGEAGFLLLSPRVHRGFELHAYIEQAVKLLPVDANRVYVIGHSMGASTVLRSFYDEQASFRAAALIGGGRPDREDREFRPQVFVATSETDFARAQAEQLAAQLKAREPEQVRFKLYGTSEHLTVVQEALDDVFEWIQEIDREYVATKTEQR